MKMAMKRQNEDIARTLGMHPQTHLVETLGKKRKAVLDYVNKSLNNQGLNSDFFRQRLNHIANTSFCRRLDELMYSTKGQHAQGVFRADSPYGLAGHLQQKDYLEMLEQGRHENLIQMIFPKVELNYTPVKQRFEVAKSNVMRDVNGTLRVAYNMRPDVEEAVETVSEILNVTREFQLYGNNSMNRLIKCSESGNRILTPEQLFSYGVTFFSPRKKLDYSKRSPPLMGCGGGIMASQTYSKVRRDFEGDSY